MSTPGPWKVDTWKYPARESGRKEEIVVVSETLRIAVLDHGDKDWEECPFAVSYKEAEENAKLIASAPLLAERVRILREALKKAKESLDYVSGYLDKEDSETVVESVNEAIDTVDAALKATKEGA